MFAEKNLLSHSKVNLKIVPAPPIEIARSGTAIWYNAAKKLAMAAPFITGKSTLTRDPVNKTVNNNHLFIHKI